MMSLKNTQKYKIIKKYKNIKKQLSKNVKLKNIKIN